MKRGEVWLADLPPPIGRRPVVLISRDKAYDIRSRISIVPVTRRIRSLPVEVLLGAPWGLKHRCAANCDEVLTTPKRRLKRRITTLPSEKIHELDEALRFALGLDV